MNVAKEENGTKRGEEEMIIEIETDVGAEIEIGVIEMKIETEVAV